MGRRCSYVGCRNKGSRSEGVRLHGFPSGPSEKRNRWLRACALSPNDSQKYIFVCSRHFVGEGGPTCLNPDPVPCESVTPARVEAVDGLLALGVCAPELSSNFPPSIDSNNLPVSVEDLTSACQRTVSENQANEDINYIYTFILKLSDETLGKLDALERVQNVEYFISSLKHLDGEKDINASSSSSFLPRSSRRSLNFDKEVSDNNFVLSRNTEDKLPFMPPTQCSKDQGQPENATACDPKISREVQCNRAAISLYQCLKSSEKDFHFFTGVTQQNFEVLYQFLGGDAVCNRLKYYSYNKSTPQKNITSFLAPRDRLFLTLLRLRRGVPVRDLAYLFGIATGTVSSIVFTWIQLMSLQIQRIEKQMFVTTEDQNVNPNPLFEKFPDLRVIIDCTEFKIQHPYHFQMQSNTFSNYKSTNTIKYLIGIARCGGIAYVSKGFEGSASDKQVVVESGFLDHLHKYDAVMADRGFNIEAELNALSVKLYIPPYLGTRKNLTAREEISSKEVTSVRSFVEVAIKRIRDFRLLRYVLPNTLLPVLDSMVRIASFISNFDEEFIPRFEDE